MTASPAELAELFRATGHAHHVETAGAATDWPLWYAERMRPELERLMGRPFQVSDIVYWLVRVERERKPIEPKPEWPEFYARFFLDVVAADPG